MKQNHKGFTLIELIVVLVVAGVVGALLIPFMSTALTRSHEPLLNLERATGLSSDMAEVLGKWENITSQCNEVNNQGFLGCIEDALDNLGLQNSEIDQAKWVMFQENNGDYSESECSGLENDPDGCKVFAGPQCRELEDGWECLEWRGQGAQKVCHTWTSDNCIIKIRLKGNENPGEILTYYFSLSSE